MNNLHDQIKESAQLLEIVFTNLNPYIFRKLPEKCIQDWSNRGSLHNDLDATASLIAIRQEAWNNLKDFEEFAKNLSGEKIKLEGRDIVFVTERHLKVMAYQTVTWTIYDRLSNVCGRICGPEEIMNHPKMNPKLCEEFLEGKRRKLAFGVDEFIRTAYAWPIKISYMLRNWLVHEGYEEGSTPLYKGNCFEHGFSLKEDAIKKLRQSCNKDKSIQNSSCILGDDDCIKGGNIIEILEQYNNEIDTMFIGLVKWITDSFASQVRVLSERDRL